MDFICILCRYHYFTSCFMTVNEKFLRFYSSNTLRIHGLYILQKYHQKVFCNKWAFLGLKYSAIWIQAISFMFYNKPHHKYCNFELKGRYETKCYILRRFKIKIIFILEHCHELHLNKKR